MPLLRFAFFICISVVVGWQCHSYEDKTVQNNQDTQEVERRDRLFYRSNTPFVRIRKTPDDKAKILLTLEKGALVEYMYDSTLFETQVRVGGNSYKSTWFYVRTPNNTIGWTQKILFNPLSYIENKELIQKIPSYDPNLIEESLSRSELRERQQVIDQQSIDRLKNKIAEQNLKEVTHIQRIIRYNQSYILGKSNKKTTDVALMETYQFIDKTARNIPDHTLKNYQTLIDDIRSYGSYDTDQDDFCKKLKDNFLHFSIEENTIVVRADLDQLLRIFYRELSEQMRSYIDLYTAIYIKDPRLDLIEISSLKNTLIKSHQFVLKNKDFMYWKKAKEQHEHLLQIILQGENKQPIFNRDNKLKEPYQKLYRSIAEKDDHKEITDAFNELIQHYKKNNWTATDNWLEVTQQIKNKLMSTLEE